MIFKTGIVKCPYCDGPSGRWSAEGYWALAPEDQIIYGLHKVCCVTCSYRIESSWLYDHRTSQDLLLAINHNWCEDRYTKRYKELLEHIQ